MPETAPSAWQPLRLLTFYRVVLAGLLAVLYFALIERNPFNVQLPVLFRTTLLAYLGFSVVIGFAARLRWPGFRFQSQLQILVDIGAIALMMHATGGVSSALSVLLVIAVATGALLLPGRLAYLFAAVATLAVLFETGLASLSLAQAGPEAITRAGVLGMVLFATAGLAHILSLRVRESEALARQRGLDVANLEQLNQYIIRQLESGVMVVDAKNRIRLANHTARQLLGLDHADNQDLAGAAPDLALQLRLWTQEREWQPQAVQSRTAGTTVIPRFSTMRTADGDSTLVLLDDSSRLARQTQQMRLASLGRLTASIAHEIRNPLGAISHAAQLLQESEQLDSSDRRLTEIIGNHTQRVNTIIENVLQLSRRSASQPQTVTLTEWLQDFKHEFEQTEQIQPERLQVDVSPPDLQVLVDPGHLHQILTNLCQNAFRYAGDAVSVVVRAGMRETGAVRLDVVDNGSGMDAETAEQIFEPFFTTASTGTGLGLYIARELCEINQARLSYQPTEDGGSCFSIHFAAGYGEQG